MVRLKFSIHPLFFIFGLYFAFTGKVFSFIVYTLCAVIHELGHFNQSEKLGYALNKIVLMPYGALIKGDMSELRYKDEVLIALAGPFYNLSIGFFVVALWWIFPLTYPYTEIMGVANFSLAIINLLPCYPLDGGRVILATLSLCLSRKTAKIIVKSLSILLSLILLAFFIYSIFIQINLTLLFFSLFILVGVVDKRDQSDYVKIYQNLTYKSSNRPQTVKRIIVSGETEIKWLYKTINKEYYYQILVENNGKKVLIEGERLYKILSESSAYQKLSEVI